VTRCPACGGRLRLVAALTDPASIRRLASRHKPPPAADGAPPRSPPTFQLFASKTPFFAQRAPPLSSTGWPRPKKGAPKAAHPAANGTSTRLNRLTRKPKRAFIVPIHDIQRSIYGPKTRFRNGPIIGEKTTLFAPVRYREHNISEQTFYRWKKEYGNMELADFWVPYKVGRGF